MRFNKRDTWVACLILAALGCDDNEPKAADMDASASTSARYVISTTVSSEDTSTSYLPVVSDLYTNERVSLSAAIELGGDARAYGPPKRGVVYTTSNEDGTFTEIAFDDDGNPSKGRVLSLTGLGITSTTGGNVHHFFADDKAYFISQDSLELIVWNPKEMEIIRTVSLELSEHLVAEDGYFFFYPRPIIVDDKLVLIANQSDSNDVDGPTVVVVIDTTDDSVLSTRVDGRCPGLLQSAVDADGDRYFASSSYSAAIHFMAPEAPAPCMVRVRRGETELDPDWSRSLTEPLGSRLWTGVTPGANGAMFVQSIAEDSPGVTDAKEPFDLTVASPWRWQLLKTGDSDPETVDADYLDAPPDFPAIEPDQDMSFITTWDQADSTLLDLQHGDYPKRARVVPGFVYNIVRIR